MLELKNLESANIVNSGQRASDSLSPLESDTSTPPSSLRSTLLPQYFQAKLNFFSSINKFVARHLDLLNNLQKMHLNSMLVNLPTLTPGSESYNSFCKQVESREQIFAASLNCIGILRLNLDRDIKGLFKEMSDFEGEQLRTSQPAFLPKFNQKPKLEFRMYNHDHPIHRKFHPSAT